MPIKVEEQLEIQHINVPVKDEPEDEMALVKGEDSDLGNNNWSDSASSDYGHASVLETDLHANLLEYIKLVGATQSIADGENIFHDGKIFNPTPEG
ncbi:hypothetical protein D9619_004443 [Psilocybe cf. subviscida]|uniref:Uncharacterized protein n=1 Tax=Psilocybe cf. subviscida TaxID=2480587 RepID=A0A8H5BQC7_9AGAR|nr:hypothetical protein D9619_004443 [Psilocybe cf. subviscida]